MRILFYNLQNSHFWMVRKRHFLHHILKKSYFHTIIALALMKLLKNTQTIYAVSGFTHPPQKNSEKYHFFLDFSRFSLMVSSTFLHYSPLSFIITKCNKMSSKKTQKKWDFLFQHSILFSENGQK
jgi:hypothetical protein